MRITRRADSFLMWLYYARGHNAHTIITLSADQKDNLVFEWLTLNCPRPTGYQYHV